jgi:2-keto-3-deoxy-L-rhamnonate aldolase RhmA
MLARKIKEKMLHGEPTLGTWMSMAHPSIAEILAMAGYDWVVIDTEHSCIDVSEVLRLIIAIEQRGSVPLVRLAGIDPVQAKAVLDAGAAGVLVPMVNRKADAELAVQMTKYPLLGSRGACLARAQGYGENFDAYVQNANADTLLIVQIEHKDAVANIEEILSVQGIDGTFIGPYDLSLSLGIPGQLSHPEVLEAKRKVREATRAHGLVAGVHLVQPSTAVDDCRQAIMEGYRFIALGTDILFLGDSARALRKEISQYRG